MRSTNQVSPSGKLLTQIVTNLHTPKKVGKIPPVVEKLHLFENAVKINKHPGKCTEPDGKSPTGASATSYHRSIKVLALRELHTALIDTVESESCIYEESVSTDTVDANNGSVYSHMNGTWKLVKSMKSHC
jgi:hypothetical protein